MPAHPFSRLTLLVLLLLSLPSVAEAQGDENFGQGEEPQFVEFTTGEISPIMVKAYFLDVRDGRRILFLPDSGLACKLFMRNAFDEAGWAYWFMDQGWSTFTLDYPASNDSPPLQNDDLVLLTEGAIEGVYRTGMASFPRVFCAQGLGAAFAVKLRSTTPDAIPAAILIDPWGVRDINPPLQADEESLLERRENLEDHLWVEWGLGPRPGELYPDSDLGEEGFRRLLEAYDLDAPPYWATVLTGLNSWMQILNPKYMDGWPVLVVRGAHPTAEMDARREAVTAWLEENGAQVERLDLAEEGPSGLSNLPMAGRKADLVAEMLFEWCRNLPDNPRFPHAAATP